MQESSEHGRIHAAAATRCPAATPVAAVVRQFVVIIERLDDAQYVQAPVGPFTSSIGGQVRHSLDHVAAYLTAVTGGTLDYDHRERGTSVEVDRAAALAATHRLADGLLALDPASLGRTLTMDVMLAPHDAPLQVASTYGRELAFVLSHTIHHGAMIAAMATLLGVPVPEDFGVAPSTRAALESRSCAR